DGTLVDTAPDLWAALNAALATKDLAPVPLSRVNHLVGQGALVMIERGLAEHGETVDRDELRRLHDVFLDHYGANIARDSTPFPGCVRALDQLAASGHTLAVCTNKYAGMSKSLLEELGLSDRFAVIAGPDTFDVKKPDPAHVLKTVEAAGGTRQRSIMVGDSINDIAAARDAGVLNIGVSFGYTDVPMADLNPDHLIDHYDQLVPIVEAFTARESPVSA
ncbi:MAG: HAD-IA family hydrolase, partial [Pseudomonadota bacterium]